MKTLIVVPTYNEIQNVPKLLGRLMNLDPELHVLVVDDNSPDGTGDWVESFSGQQPRVHLLRKEKKNGLGPAYIEGFKWGLARDYDLFFEMDADLSHRPRYIPKFLELMQQADMAVGSRWITDGRVANWPMNRVLLSRLANLYCQAVLQVPISDMTAGFVCYRRAILESLDLNQIRSDGYGFQIEMKYRAIQNGFRLREIPITFTDRQEGISKISKRIIWEALWIVWHLKFTKNNRKRLKPVCAES